MDHIVVDVEIQRAIEETPGGWGATDLLGVAVACVWEYSSSRMRVYGPDEVPALQKRLLKADRISGFNIADFDFPVIWGMSRTAWSAASDDPLSIRNQLALKTDDLLQRIWKALGRREKGWKLENIATATLGVGKIGNGEEAPRQYQAGKIQAVTNYCADDVALERDLIDYVDRYGRVLNWRGEPGFGSPIVLPLPKWEPTCPRQPTTPPENVVKTLNDLL